MNAYIADRIAREHTDRLMAEAAAWRRSRTVRNSRRAARTSTASGSGRTRRSRRVAARPGTAAAHFVARPFVAIHSWLVAGEM